MVVKERVKEVEPSVRGIYAFRRPLNRHRRRGLVHFQFNLNCTPSASTPNEITNGLVLSLN